MADLVDFARELADLVDFARELVDERVPVALARELPVLRRVEPPLEADPDPERLAWGIFFSFGLSFAGFACTLLLRAARRGAPARLFI